MWSGMKANGTEGRNTALDRGLGVMAAKSSPVAGLKEVRF